ncbi:UDP-3-O-(3-hydroxymyristoyl)glucosamine N-acyltransferase [Oceanicoccus sp. KOV_DT_Chl]|uniref:UDP-3-O-(3-hydroxymyristoyl)glucosamine N-acyltransferase n=1 Tax=Oceanicoccus sp. KOV_DT_Chl TaxID=1904639 RepID=UPI000C7A8D12|nr:UDP-3-O-(3-hydroxymyristoyl)glucosamine N-acyltransferase [Oceanicoccus sp. KOV_DT_Chl]
MKSQRQYTLAQLAGLLDVKCVGDSEMIISGLATLAAAGDHQLSFLANSKYQQALKVTAAAAVIVSPDQVSHSPCACLVSSNPYLTYARASQLFAPDLSRQAGIHPSAVISDSASIDATASIAANVVIEAGVSVGANTVISAGCVIGQGSNLGSNCLLHANVTIYHGITLGNHVLVHSGTVIGSDGFGFAPSPDKTQGGWIKIAQLGGVVIGNHVEIGASCTIDRGALEDTVLADRVILDNQVQIAHNVRLGENTAIAGCTAIAGSTRVGRNCTIAGGVGIVGHIDIVDGVHVTAMTLVTKSITEAGSYSAGTPMQSSASWRKSAVRFSQLEAMNKRLKDVEKNLKES